MSAAASDGNRRRANVADGGPTRLVGVVNITPDSFSDGGRFLSVEHAVEHALALDAAGAAALDLGAESTRPGYEPVPAKTQLERLLPVLAALRPHTDCALSIDTTRADVAVAALRAGADWINDTTAFTDDPAMAKVVAEHDCPAILMHRFEPPRRSGDAREPHSVADQVAETLRRRVDHAVQQGVRPERLLLDPGIGFGTLPADNAVLCAEVEPLRALGRPLVYGPSRKSFLGHLTGRPVDERVAATAACVAALTLAGVDFIRVHDVAEMLDVVTVAQAIREGRREHV
ncbi:MAG: dihydropteroate synthase [Planctomycetota bacterium]